MLLHLQVVQTLLESADEVGNLLILHGQCVGDLPQRFLKKKTKFSFSQFRFFLTFLL